MNRDVMQAFDHLFWLGDLNYRINYSENTANSPTPEDFNAVVKLIEQEDYDTLFLKDQLSAELKSHRVFYGFIEG